MRSNLIWRAGASGNAKRRPSEDRALLLHTPHGRRPSTIFRATEEISLHNSACHPGQPRPPRSNAGLNGGNHAYYYLRLCDCSRGPRNCRRWGLGPFYFAHRRHAPGPLKVFRNGNRNDIGRPWLGGHCAGFAFVDLNLWRVFRNPATTMKQASVSSADQGRREALARNHPPARWWRVARLIRTSGGIEPPPILRDTRPPRR
jgi:hypothetical protein